MSNKYQISKEAEEYLNSPLAVGDYVSVKKKDVSSFSNGGEVNGYIENVYEDGTCDVRISDSSSMYNDEIHKLENEKIKKDSLFIGYNPFDEYKSMPRLTLLAYSIDSILSVLGIDSWHDPYVIKNNAGENAIMNELNWNPYVTDKNGERLYYQRDFCWTTNDKQLLIESIYRGVDCGKIVVREHSYKEVESEIKLRAKINELLTDFSLKYDVVCARINIAENGFYNKLDSAPMYLIDTDWKFVYLY